MAVQAGRRVPLNRERVLQAALQLVDEGGIEALSMRKLGQSLGVEAMSLYNHVANKDDLVDGIVDLVWDEIELPTPDGDWEAEVRKLAISAHDALTRHQWACRLMMRTKTRPGQLHYMESLLGSFRRAGFSPEATYHAYHAIDSHILGFTLWQLGHQLPADMPRITSREDFIRLVSRFLGDLPLEQFPYLLEHGMQHLSEGSHKNEPEFEFKLGLILVGLKRMPGAP